MNRPRQPVQTQNIPVFTSRFTSNPGSRTGSIVHSTPTPALPGLKAPFARAHQTLASSVALALALTGCTLHAGLQPIEGRVTDTTGRPVERAVITISPTHTLPWEDKLECVTTTRDNGAFECPHLGTEPFRMGHTYIIHLEKPPLFRSSVVELRYRAQTALMELHMQERALLEDLNFEHHTSGEPAQPDMGPLP